MIRYISSGSTELIRCVYSAVRDRNWGTLVPVITQEEISAGKDHFTISYHAVYKDASIHFEADYSIEGSTDNRILFKIRGKAVNTFRKNRIGFCILHPLRGITGRPFTVTGPDGEITKSVFPEGVSSTAPMKDISAMEWENEAAKCRLSFQGDTWEMEDHRNWTDSSFKTFCTPLSIPYPVTIQAGTEVEQTVLFKAYPLKSISKVNPGIVTITPEITPLRLPLIGVGLNGELTTREAGILRLAGLHHLRHDLKFSDQNWEDQLKDAASNAISAGVGLELVLHFTEHIESNKASLQEVIQDHPIPVRRVWAIQEKTRLSHSRLISLTCNWMKEMFPDALAGGGTDAYFAEFNRNRFDAGDLDFVTFAVSPQVHAFDNDSLVENLEAQCDVLLSAQLLYPGKGLQVSPVTLKQRFNVVANGEETPLPEDQLPYPVDARQMSLFAAGWTMGSILSLARGGAGSVTFYQTTGWQGIIQGDADPAKPDLFAGRKGEIFPVYHVLRLICGLHDAVIVPYRTVPALKCTALAIEQQHQVLLLVANHTRDTLPLHLEGFKPDEFAVWDHSNLELSYHDAEFLDHLQFNKMSNVSLKVAPFSFYLLRKFL